VAQFEREMTLEWQREGIAKAKGDGKYKGRKPTIVAKADQIRAPVHVGRQFFGGCLTKKEDDL
jgi:DNA invertase Pin-like site-specific DNA recombinase